MEIWDLYDSQGNKTGLTITRGEPVPEGYYYMAIHACLFNREGSMLIQKRTHIKRAWPDVWDLTAGGGAVSGDSSQSAVARELREELGIDMSFEGQRPFITVHFNQGFDDIYIVDTEVELSSLSLQPEEVADARWASEEDILDMIDRGEFVPYHKSLIQLIFAMRKRRDAISK